MKKWKEIIEEVVQFILLKKEILENEKINSLLFTLVVNGREKQVLKKHYLRQKQKSKTNESKNNYRMYKQNGHWRGDVKYFIINNGSTLSVSVVVFST